MADFGYIKGQSKIGFIKKERFYDKKTYERRCWDLIQGHINKKTTSFELGQKMLEMEKDFPLCGWHLAAKEIFKQELLREDKQETKQEVNTDSPSPEVPINTNFDDVEF